MHKHDDLIVIPTPQQQLTPADHGRFFEIPFELPADAESLTVTCLVEGQDHAGTLVDLGLRDPEQIRGWSGGARSEFTVSTDQATPGYLPGELRPGTWAVLLASNRIPPEGCQVTLVVEYEPCRPRWLKGDLHLHSVHSDGSYELAEIFELAEAAGLDFVALTDHNTISHNIASAPPTTLVRIPGMELTTYRGHSNLLGVVAPIADFRVSSQAELAQRLAEARSNGARIVLNHPFDPGCGWDWDWAVDYDWFEVWNGPWRPSNQQALDWWHAQLVEGRRLVGVAGSDTHRPHPYVRHGYPASWIYSPAATANDILAAIDAGHVVMSYAPDGPRIELTCGAYMVGDVMPRADDQPPLSLQITALLAGDVVKVISEAGIEREWTIADGTDSLAESWRAEVRRFHRVEVWRWFAQVNQMLIAALSNPLYVG